MPIVPRVVQVAIGPSGLLGKEWQAPQDFDCEVVLDSGKRANTAVVKLYNLADMALAWLDQPNLTVRISAGQPIPNQLFFGDVDPRGIVSSWNGPTRITEVKAGEGRKQYRQARYTGSFPPGTSSDVILASVIAAMGLPLSYRDPLIVPIPYAGGFAFAGRARGALDRIAGDVGFVWSIQRGGVELMLPNSTSPNTAVVLAEDSGLIGSPKRTDRGVDLEALLQPGLRPRSIVSVASRFVSGFFRVTKIKHNVNAKGTVWKSALSAEPLQ